jgi:N-acetyl-gamma-glutamyl-phosphate reductase
LSGSKLFIDGQEGTTGLRIREMIAERDDLEVMLISDEERKDVEARARFLNQADVAILCLPDDAAAEAIAMIDNPETRVIDTSTARRIDPNWVYGLPEVSNEQRDLIRGASRVANCGCYPVGFILAVRPLVEAGVIDSETRLTVNAASGYSGGGRRMVEAYRQLAADPLGDGALPFSLYSLDGGHKHLAEMSRFSLVRHPPLFNPSVVHTYCGMLVSTPLSPDQLVGPVDCGDIVGIWKDYYRDAPFVLPMPPEEAALRDGKFLDIDGCNHTNRVELYAFGNQADGVTLVGRLDNLGKGASGNAVQCLNLMLGRDEQTGLRS